MKLFKSTISMVLVLVMIVMTVSTSFAASTLNIAIEELDWSGNEGGAAKVKVDVVSVTNVSKELSSVKHPIDNYSVYFKYLEVANSTVLTSLEEGDEIGALKIVYNDKSSEYDTTKRYYPDDEHYVEEEEGPGYYKKGSYIKLNEPGEYVVNIMRGGIEEVGFIAYIKITAGQEKPDVSEKPKTAEPADVNVLINGNPVFFDAYNIDGNNYFKLRDLAYRIMFENKRFDVTWDAEKKAINLISNTKYTPVGGECVIPGIKSSKEAKLCTSAIYKDGAEVDLMAYTIGGNNYFKLRDIAKTFNMEITWDAKTKTIGINTEADYKE